MPSFRSRTGDEVLWTMAAICAVLWTLGLITGSTVGDWDHLLLAFALVWGTLAMLGSARKARRAARSRHVGRLTAR